jgi:ABC-type transporter Mla maintaining outer membrane lipid asymmetry ATPase subunit MlaF
MVVVRLKHLFQHTGSRCLLNDISLEIREGEVFGLLGHNGSGKTTLLRLLMGLDRPTAGSIEILGRDILTLPAGSMRILRGKLGMIFQGGSLLRDLTVAENIMLPLRNTRWTTQKMRQAVRLAIIQLRLDGLEDFFPHELSGGVARQVEMARALIRRPQLLFCDELFDNLDQRANAEVEDLLTTHKRAFNMTVIMASHQMTNTLRLADRVGIIANGELIFIGTPEEAQHRKQQQIEIKYILDGRA